MKTPAKLTSIHTFFPFSNLPVGKKRKEDRAFKERQKEIEKDVKKASKQREKETGVGPSAELTSPPTAAPNRREYADENEQKIDENLDEMSLHLRTLREDATFMQKSVQEQESEIKEVQSRTTHAQNVMEISDKKLQRHL